MEKGDEVSVFMLGKGVLFETSGNDQFDVMGQVIFELAREADKVITF